MPDEPNLPDDGGTRLTHVLDTALAQSGEMRALLDRINQDVYAQVMDRAAEDDGDSDDDDVPDHDRDWFEECSCDECTADLRNEESSGDDRILDHSARIMPMFYGVGKYSTRSTYPRSRHLYMGIELEVEAVHARLTSLVDVVEASALPVYLKYDGSLERGVEIVSHPITLSRFQADSPKWESMLKELARVGGRSYNTSTCGMHVHLSRLAFGQKAEYRQIHLYHFMHLIYMNPGLTLLVSQRRPALLQRWASLLDRYSREDALFRLRLKSEHQHNHQDQGRYVAVNVENRRTIEVRIFRGTLNTNSFWKNIEFCAAAFDYTKNIDGPDRAEELTDVRFLSWVEAQQKRYPHLQAFLSQSAVRAETVTSTGLTEVPVPSLTTPEEE